MIVELSCQRAYKNFIQYEPDQVLTDLNLASHKSFEDVTRRNNMFTELLRMSEDASEEETYEVEMIFDKRLVG